MENFIAHEYQQYAIRFIEEHPIAALLLDMGLGKTVITLTAINNLLFDTFEVEKVLVVAPLRVARDVWPDEIKKWRHLQDLTYSVAVGDARQRKAALLQQVHIHIINRENLHWLVSQSHIPFDWDMVVIDELSSFKSHQSVRFKAMKAVRAKIKRIIGLTGTPASNGLIDLWAPFRLLDNGERLGRFIGRYREEFFVPDKRNGQIVYSYKPKPGAEDAIYAAISDIAMSMKGVDHLTLPECVINEVLVKLSPAELETLKSMKRDLIANIAGEIITAANAAVLSNKLLQMANGAIYTDDGKTTTIHDRKFEALEELVEAANGKPVLIAYWFKHDLARIRQRFKQAETLDSADSINRWNNGEVPVACIHPASAGHGLNLQQGGATLIWFGLTWSLELYQQTNARLWRQGQKEMVIIHHLVAQGTIDQNVMSALRRKEKTQSALIEAVKAQIGR